MERNPGSAAFLVGQFAFRHAWFGDHNGVMMKNYRGKRVLVIGAARQGLALARFLAKAGALVTVNDKEPAEKLQPAMISMKDLSIRWVCGEHPLILLDSTDLVGISGGVPMTLPIISETIKRAIPMTNDSQVFLEETPCEVTGITGSAGKTTTTTLVGRMAQASAGNNKISAWVGGNIGDPLLNHLHEMKSADLAIMEVSSFQLEQMEISPHIAAILNITPNHLDRHGTMEAYTAAKARILQYQKSGDVAILNREDHGSWNLMPKVRGKLLSFGLDVPETRQAGAFIVDYQVCYSDGNSMEILFPVADILLRGKHNLLNVLAAVTIAKAMNLTNDEINTGVRGFGGVAHRLELVREIDGVRWYNDSIATAPERSIAAIQSFDEPIILLAGGRDKNLPWQEFAHKVQNRVKHLILFGEASSLIKKAVEEAEPGRELKSITVCDGLVEAIDIANQTAESGDVILLSPGGTSYDAYKDFEQRGEEFRKWVHQLS